MIAALTAAGPVIKAAHLPDVGSKGAPKLGVFIEDDIMDDFISAMKTPRFRNRDVGAVRRNVSAIACTRGCEGDIGYINERLHWYGRDADLTISARSGVLAIARPGAAKGLQFTDREDDVLIKTFLA